MALEPPETHPFRRAFDCVQWEEGSKFVGCSCPAWDNQIIDKQPGQPIRILRGCVFQYFQFMSRTMAVASLQTLEAIDGAEEGKVSLRGDMQALAVSVDGLERQVVSGLNRIGAAVVVPLERLAGVLDRLAPAGAERVLDAPAAAQLPVAAGAATELGADGEEGVPALIPADARVNLGAPGGETALRGREDGRARVAGELAIGEDRELEIGAQAAEVGVLGRRQFDVVGHLAGGSRQDQDGGVNARFDGKPGAHGGTACGDSAPGDQHQGDQCDDLYGVAHV